VTAHFCGDAACLTMSTRVLCLMERSTHRTTGSNAPRRRAFSWPHVRGFSYRVMYVKQCMSTCHVLPVVVEFADVVCMHTCVGHSMRSLVASSAVLRDFSVCFERMFSPRALLCVTSSHARTNVSHLFTCDVNIILMAMNLCIIFAESSRFIHVICQCVCLSFMWCTSWHTHMAAIRLGETMCTPTRAATAWTR